MQDFEKLGVFYLGRAYDLDAGTRKDELVLYDSRDLVTHGVCVGMTGSGKTGLCLSILEEAAIDGVPVIAIDPKGDLGNLLLTFPDLAPADFRPWVNEDDARRKGVTADRVRRRPGGEVGERARRVGPGRRADRPASERRGLRDLHAGQQRRPSDLDPPRRSTRRRRRSRTIASCSRSASARRRRAC